jgi:hypothetical protein
MAVDRPAQSHFFTLDVRRETVPSGLTGSTGKSVISQNVTTARSVLDNTAGSFETLTLADFGNNIDLKRPPSDRLDKRRKSTVDY